MNTKEGGQQAQLGELVPSKGLEIQPVLPILTVIDTDWLEPLRGQAIDEEWFARANHLVDLGSRHIKPGLANQEERTSIIKARQDFYGEALGFNKPEHEFHDVYGWLKSRRIRGRIRQLTPPATFIETMRVLHRHSENLREVIHNNWIVMTLGASSVEQKMSQPTPPSLHLQAVRGTQVYIGRDSKTVNHLLRKYELSIAALGWGHSCEELIELNPVVARMSDEKLTTHARLFARFGHPDMDPREIRNMLTYPLEAHLIAIDRGERPYSAQSVRMATKMMPDAQRQEYVKARLQNPDFIQLMGRKTVQAYTKYRAHRDHSVNVIPA